MESIKEQFEDLVIQELLGTLSDADGLTLQELIDQYPELRDYRAEIIAVFNTPAGSRTLRSTPLTTESVFKHGRKKKNRRLLIRAVIASAACLAFFLIRDFGSFKRSNTSLPSSLSLKDEKHIVLTLADGKAVTLDTSTGLVKINAITFLNDSNGLSMNNISAKQDQWATLTVPPGKDYKIHLPDGSEVWLNSATSIRFPLMFTGNQREISIDGEAYFKIAPIINKPFIVQLPLGRVDVLGTEFNVNTYDSSHSSLSLVSGSVKMVLPNHTVLVRPGYEISYSTSTVEDQKLFDPRTVLGWRNGVCVYENASLQDIALILHRWFGVKVVLDNDAVSAMRFNGSVRRDENLTDYLENLQYTNGPSFYIRDSVIHFK